MFLYRGMNGGSKEDESECYFQIHLKLNTNIIQKNWIRHLNNKLRIEQNKMSLLKYDDEDDELFDPSSSQQFSVEEETEQLLNEVFNQRYEPVYNPDTTKIKEEEYKKIKQETNEIYKERIKDKKDLFHRVYQNIDNQAVPATFKQFLMKSQERIDKKNYWLRKERQKKEAQATKDLKEKPTILRGSTKVTTPIYERCIDLQKQKEKHLEAKRKAKFRRQVTEALSHSYHPKVNHSDHNRTFEQYISQKQGWQKAKQEQLQKKRVTEQVKKLSQCTFAPNLVAKFNKNNSRIIQGERVEDRLLRTLGSSLQKTKKK